MYDVGLLTRGRTHGASNGASFERANPVTGEIVTRAAAATREDARNAAAESAAVFPAWRGVGPAERRRRLMAAADAVEAHTSAFSATMSEEIGATEAWVQFNVSVAAALLREAASLCTAISGKIVPSDRPGTQAFAMRQAAGVVLGIAPWNAPVILGVRAAAMPLACGNTVVLKASEVCPRTHRLVGEILDAALKIEGAVNVVTNAPADAESIVEAIVAHPAVRRINFTGSTRSGRRVAAIAAKHLKPVLLELGGHAPLIVLDDADLEAAVAAASYGSFLNQGQVCMSTERIVVDQKIADAFAQMLALRAASLIASDPRRTNLPLGALVSTAAAERINLLLRDAISKGGRLLAGGPCQGVLMDATVLDHVTPAMYLYSEEIFGPVASIIRVEGADEAVRVANETQYGLSAAVFGRDVARAFDVAQRIESGICHVNAATIHDEPQMPFGGMKDSGYGRFGGEAAINEFTELRWLTINQGRQSYPL